MPAHNDETGQKNNLKFARESVDDHAQGAALQGEGDGERADVFPVEFKGVRRILTW